MKFCHSAVFVGLSVWLSLVPASFAAPDAKRLPPAEVVLPPPVLIPDTPPPPAEIEPVPAAEPEPAAVSPAPESSLYYGDWSLSAYDYSNWPLWAQDAWDITADAVHDHLRIGIRFRQVNLEDDQRTADDSFLGSITELNNRSSYELISWLTFDWLFNPYVGGRLVWEQVRAQTFTDQGTSGLNHSDGKVDLFGPSLMLLLRYPNQTRFVPTVGIGYAWLTSSFEHNPVWHNGFGGPARQQGYDAWVAAGSPPWPNNGYQRTISLDDTTAVILYGELAFQITPQLDIHGYIESMDVKGVDLSYELSSYGNTFRTESAVFPMSNTSYGLGLRWTF